MQATLFQQPATQQPAAPAILGGGVTEPRTAQDLERLIYPNGGGHPAEIKFHEDGGHGWLQVPHSLISKLGLTKKISKYSYRDNVYAYLEEDCDLSTFVRALNMPQNDLMKEFWSMCPQEYNEDSPIRKKRHY